MTQPSNNAGAFECRDITICHQSLWDAITAWADSRNMDLVPVPGTGSDEDHLPAYIFSPRSVR